MGAWAALLSARFSGQPVAVAVEQSRGPPVFMLAKYEQLQVYPIHPRAASQFVRPCFLPGPKMISWMQSYCWICWCIIACACAA